MSPRVDALPLDAQRRLSPEDLTFRVRELRKFNRRFFKGKPLNIVWAWSSS